MKITGLVSLNEYMEQGSDVTQDYSVNHTTARFDSPEESIEKEELTKVLGEALQLLTEKEQKVITLYYFEELTLKEISSIGIEDFTIAYTRASENEDEDGRIHGYTCR
jgi:RNA polymerase sigma factor for flagellar operon FliA